MEKEKCFMMNCLLAGAKAVLLLQQGKPAEAREALKISSELGWQDLDYLITRLEKYLKDS